MLILVEVNFEVVVEDVVGTDVGLVAFVVVIVGFLVVVVINDVNLEVVVVTPNI